MVVAGTSGWYLRIDCPVQEAGAMNSKEMERSTESSLSFIHLIALRHSQHQQPLTHSHTNG